MVRHRLVDPREIILPPLHVKLGLMRQFVKAFDKDGSCFNFIVRKLAAVSIQKLRNGVLDGPQIRRLTEDPAFIGSMKQREAAAWESFVSVTRNFLGTAKPRILER